jgi:hypothetical protein
MVKRKIVGSGSLILTSYADIKYSPIYILLSYWLGGPIAMYISYSFVVYFSYLTQKGDDICFGQSCRYNRDVMGFMLL